MLRVIAGAAKGRRLKSVPGEGTRPALAQVRAAVFNIAQLYVSGSSFLDLFAGTGAYAIEALSRGAKSAVLVDVDSKAAAVMEHNLKICGFEGQASVVNADALKVVERLKKQEAVFDIIMVAPPYFNGLGPRAMEKIGESSLLARDGLCFVQHHVKEEIQDRFSRLALVRRYRYGTNVLSLYRYGAGDSEGDSPS